MVLTNRLAKGSRPAVDHQPESPIFVRLKLDEMIAAAQRGELEGSLLAAGRLNAGVAECDLPHGA
jgi:hypothetical protein